MRKFAPRGDERPRGKEDEVTGSMGIEKQSESLKVDYTISTLAADESPRLRGEQ